MPQHESFFLAIAILAITILYSSVGQAGASGYVAVMSLFSIALDAIKPIAFALNITVATITTVQFLRAGLFSWALFWPFAVSAVPMAFAGGYVSLPTSEFKIIAGIAMFLSATWLMTDSRTSQTSNPTKSAAIAIGGSIGLLSGLTGTGGGIFLTPILVLMRWSDIRTASGISAPFILVNSIAGLIGNVSATKTFPIALVPLLFVAAVGGVIGSHWGSTRMSSEKIKLVLAVVLLIAGGKLILIW